MNEIVLNAGGRRFYNEDLMDLQDHLIALQGIFASEPPFVISGLTFVNTGGTLWDISEGLLWLGGKIRFYGGVEGLDLGTAGSNPQYLNAINTSNSRLYDDNNTRVSNNFFNIILDVTGSGGNDELRIDDPTDIRRYYENVLGDKYLQLDLSESQSILGNIVLNGTLTSTANISTSANLSGANLTVTNNAVIGGYVQATQEIIGKEFRVANAPQPTILSDGNINTDRVITDSVKDAAITSEKIATNAVGYDEIVSDSIDSIHIKADAITSSKIAENAVGYDEIMSDSIDSIHIKVGAITSSRIAENAVGTSEIAENAVGYDEIVSDSIDSIHIRPNAVGSSELSSNSVATNAITFGFSEIKVVGSTLFSVPAYNVDTINVVHNLGISESLTRVRYFLEDAPTPTYITTINETNNDFDLRIENLSNITSVGRINYEVVVYYNT